MSKEYIGSQEHWEDEINADYDQRERMQQEQVDDRLEEQEQQPNDKYLDILYELQQQFISEDESGQHPKKGSEDKFYALEYAIDAYEKEQASTQRLREAYEDGYDAAFHHEQSDFKKWLEKK